MEEKLAKIAAIVFFPTSAGMVAVGLGYFAHDIFYVPRAAIRETALIASVFIAILVLIGYFGDTSNNGK